MTAILSDMDTWLVMSNFCLVNYLLVIIKIYGVVGFRKISQYHLITASKILLVWTPRFFFLFGAESVCHDID